MTLYEMIEQVSDILTPESKVFYDYVLHTSDDNGFLRTRYCWLEQTLKNRNLSKKYNVVMVSMNEPFEEEKITNVKSSPLKMQIEAGEPTIVDIELSKELGYPYIYVFDLESKTYTTIFN